VFDRISPGEMSRVMPVLEVVSPVAHVDVHSKRTDQLQLTPQEVLENPTVDDTSSLFSDDVNHNRSSPRELEENCEDASRATTYHEDASLNITEELSTSTPIPVVLQLVNNGLSANLENRDKGAMQAKLVVEKTKDHLETFNNKNTADQPNDQPVVTLDISEESLVDVDVTEISFQEGVAQHSVTNIHSSARIQQDLELWRRFKEYDQKSADEPFLPVLSRKLKQHL